MTSKIQRPSMGVLKLNECKEKFSLSRVAPSEGVDFFVKHFWIIRWDLPKQETHVQDVIPNPCVNMVIQQEQSGIFGIPKCKYSKTLSGKGSVFGVKFKPGGFFPFMYSPVSTLTDDSIGIEGLFDIDNKTIENAILSQKDDIKMVEYMESIIRRKLPKKDDTIIMINRMIDQISENHDITKVDHLCHYFHINKRTLQRLFDKYVGVSPKWVIKLYRLQNAAEQIDRDQPSDWVDLSMDLGYYDQSHFIRDFKSIIGKTPEEYLTHKQ